MSFALLLCVMCGHAWSVSNASFTLLYLAPIAFAAWFVSLRAALLLSTASAFASIGVDAAARQHPLSQAVLAWNVAVQLGVFVALVLLVDALKSRLEQEQRLARTDPLTLIANRRSFLETAEIELARAQRTGRPLTLAYLDADDFKEVNDRAGHAEGDALLATAASTLRRQTRAMDAVARLGGDEFGLLLVDTDPTAAESLVLRLRNAMATAFAANGWKMSFSIGAVTFLQPPATLDEMLCQADRLMYEAKRAGKDTARFAVVARQPTAAKQFAAG